MQRGNVSQRLGALADFAVLQVRTSIEISFNSQLTYYSDLIMVFTMHGEKKRYSTQYTPFIKLGAVMSSVPPSMIAHMINA